MIDDEMDYFSVESNVWLSPEQRAELKQKEEELFQKKHASRLNKSVRVTIDFAGRQVIQPADEADVDAQKPTLDGSVDGPLLGRTVKRIGKSDAISGKILCPFVVGHEPKVMNSGYHLRFYLCSLSCVAFSNPDSLFSSKGGVKVTLSLKR